MFVSIGQFEEYWRDEAQKTLTVFGALTDDSLSQAVAEGHRNLGRLAWHITTTIPEMLTRMGLSVSLQEDAPVPAGVAEIREQYSKATEELVGAIKANWTDATLGQEDDMYGMKWRRGLSLWILLIHQTHHRGQMTVLMRQAGLPVPGVYGPAKEEWSGFGGSPPAV